MKLNNDLLDKSFIKSTNTTSDSDTYSCNYVNNALAKLGKTLWRGSFTSGDITVNELSNYSIIGIVADGVLCIGNTAFGGGIYGKYGGTDYGVVSYRLFTSGNTMSITNNDKGAYNSGTQVAITEVIGIL